jgi:hypothetical protein
VSDKPVAFMSYARFNDLHDDGQLSLFRDRLAAEVRAQTGLEFVIFQDRTDIEWGQNWRQRIDEALDAATLLLVIITPGFFQSPECRGEVSRFLEREQALGRSDLILPVYYISAREIDDPVARDSDEAARVLASRQFADWRELRFEPFSSPLARKAVAQLASRMRDTFWQQASVRAQPTDAITRSIEHAGIEDRVTAEPRPSANVLPRKPLSLGPLVLVGLLRHKGAGWFNGGVRAVAFSPDGTLLASGGGDNIVRIWDTATSLQVQTLTGHTGVTGWSAGVFSLAFSPDGASLASGGADNTVRIWETTSWKRVRTLTGSHQWT